MGGGGGSLLNAAAGAMFKRAPGGGLDSKGPFLSIRLILKPVGLTSPETQFASFGRGRRRQSDTGALSDRSTLHAETNMEFA